MNKHILSLSLLLIICGYSQAQILKDQYIVTVKRGQVERLILQMENTRNAAQINYRVLSRDLNIIELTNHTEADPLFENELDQNPLIKSWGYNQKTIKRAIPDDQYFDMQWGLDLIDAPSAWDVTTGGQDIQNREIVIAVLDDGFDINHSELDGRILINSGEIEDDGIDNDNNGYIDDYIGWNTKQENDNHPVIDNHGIAVAGIIGAKSDNTDGMAGINWNVKILLISGIATISETIAGYQYALDMRRRYNETDGEEGAYIVATNYSAGIDGGSGTSPQFAGWCDMYDAMGEVGILSAGATTNKNTDVDVKGDIPSTCPSPFLITVTNVDKEDSKVASAGFGLQHVDLAAPGRGTLTLNINNGYDQSFGGTSAATPHVAGAIGLLYSAPCQSIADLAIDNPTQAATEIRDAIFAGVDPNSTVEGITATGGRLNIYNSIEKLQALCDELQLPSAKGPIEITRINYELGSSMEINYLTPDEEAYDLLISDALGRTIRLQNFTPPSFGRKSLSINIPPLPKGIYFITIYNDNGISTEKVFIYE